MFIFKTQSLALKILYISSNFQDCFFNLGFLWPCSIAWFDFIKWKPNPGELNVLKTIDSSVHIHLRGPRQNTRFDSMSYYHTWWHLWRCAYWPNTQTWSFNSAGKLYFQANSISVLNDKHLSLCKSSSLLFNINVWDNFFYAIGLFDYSKGYKYGKKGGVYQSNLYGFLFGFKYRSENLSSSVLAGYSLDQHIWTIYF